MLLDYFRSLLTRVIAESETKLENGELNVSESLQIAEIIETLGEAIEVLEDQIEDAQEETEIEPEGY